MTTGRKVFFLERKKQRTFAILLLVALGFSACGKYGPPSPPGPADQIIYPKTYPVK
jgi:hypothetical protein